MKRAALYQFPYYVLLLSIYPVLALYALNIKQINGALIMRSLIISFVSFSILLVLSRLIFRNWVKAGLFTALVELLFFSYGHLYGLLEKFQIGTFRLGQHKILLPVYILFFGLGLWFIIKWKKDPLNLSVALDIFSLVLLIFPIITIVSFSIRNRASSAQFQSELQSMPDWAGEAKYGKPDIYYIILDTYTRSDSLLNDFQYDNSSFEEALRERGFFIADCSRANYDYTLGSMVSALNMSYMDTIDQVLSEAGIAVNDVWGAIKHSYVRLLLEQLGYTTIAFDTGYEWSQITDADIYFPLKSSSGVFGLLNPFETMLIRTTLADAFFEWYLKFNINSSDINNHPFKYHIRLEQFLLSQVVKVASLRGPKFVFVHILIPHVPYVFRADGTLNTDPAYWSEEDWHAADEQHTIDGYIGEVQFINDRLLQVVDGIQDASDLPPIIILQGDHGLRDDNRQKIFNAYLLPNIDLTKISPSISPVNTFRLIFDDYFGTDYGLLPDKSYASDENYQLLPETSPRCIEQK